MAFLLIRNTMLEMAIRHTHTCIRIYKCFFFRRAKVQFKVFVACNPFHPCLTFEDEARSLGGLKKQHFLLHQWQFKVLVACKPFHPCLIFEVNTRILGGLKKQYFPLHHWPNKKVYGIDFSCQCYFTFPIVIEQEAG
jgi:hypothetical protein